MSGAVWERLFGRLIPGRGDVLRRLPAEVAPRRSAHQGAVTRGGFAAARVPA